MVIQTDNGLSDDGRHDKKSCKRKRQLSASLTPPPVKRERLDDVPLKIKSEPKEEPVGLKALPQKQRDAFFLCLCAH